MRLTVRNPDQCFWHLLFPLGGREQLTRNGPKGATVMVQEFDEDWCTGLVRANARYMEQSGKLGSAPQPLPVSVDHVIIDKMMGKEVEIDPARCADILGLHFAPEGKPGAPAGVYGLIQWSHFDELSNGGRSYLSPTTKAVHVMRDGTKIAGPFLMEIGLVALPALDTIGSALERLAFDSFALPEHLQLPASGEDSIAPIVLRISDPCPGVIMRGATYIEEAPVELSPEMLAKIDEMLGAKIADAEERMFKRACDAMDERMKMREVAAPTLPVSEPEPVVEPEPVEEEPTLEERALRIATDAANAEAIGLLEKRHLLHVHVSDFVARRLAGDDCADLIRDYSALAKPQGIAGGTVVDAGNAEPETRSVSEDAILTEAALAVAKGGDITAEFNRIRADYVTRGYTVEA